MLEIQYIVGLVMGLAQVLKRWISAEHLPFAGDPKLAIKDGIVAGGLAIGIFSGVKNTFEKREPAGELPAGSEGVAPRRIARETPPRP